MARIPLVVARPVLDAGPLVRYPQGGGPVGMAVEGLGAEIAGLAAHVEAAGRRREAFDAALREQEFLEELDATAEPPRRPAPPTSRNASQ